MNPAIWETCGRAQDMQTRNKAMVSDMWTNKALLRAQPHRLESTQKVETQGAG